MRSARGRRCSPRTLVVSIGAAVALAGIAPATAAAHVGELKTTVIAGPYRLAVRALAIRADGRSALAFRSTVVARRGGAPVTSARVRIFVHEPSGAVRGPYDAPVLDGNSAVFLPIGDASAWRRLRFVIDVEGSAGSGSGRYVPPSLWHQWLDEPVLFALTGVAALCFLQGFVRLRRRGRADYASFGRLALFVFGLALMVLPLVSPLDVVGDHYLLSAHMLQHVLIGDAAPAVILVALRGPLLYFVVPPLVLRRLGRARWLRTFSAQVLRPKVALAVWAVAYFGWHLPVAYDYAATHQKAHDLEHLSFVAAGFLVWALLVDPAGRHHLSRGRRLALAAALFGMGTVLADVLIFSFRPLYPFYANQAERVFLLSPVHDQQLAGLVMTVEQLVTLGTCVAILLWPALRAQRRPRRSLNVSRVSA